MGKEVVFVGGGHAHLTSLKHIDQFVSLGHGVTLISPAPYHFYSGMGPGLLSGIYRPQEVCFNVKMMTEAKGARFLEDKVIRVDPSEKKLILGNGETVGYDVVSFNVGSDIPTASVEISGEGVYTVKPIFNLLKGRQQILDGMKKKRMNILVVGGGAAGVELAGNIWRLVSKKGGRARIILIAGGKILGRFPEKARKYVIQSFEKRGVEWIEDCRVSSLRHGEATLTDHEAIQYDIVFLALGTRPSSLFRDSGIPTGEDGGLLVNKYLQGDVHPEIFGGGDCISFKGYGLEKVGVYAVRQNQILYHNLRSALEGGRMKSFNPGRAYLLILNLGDGSGIFSRRGMVFRGKLAFRLKDYIDRNFMKKFHVFCDRVDWNVEET
jgi:NADH dehydrogenase FAD-containing subunit